MLETLLESDAPRQRHPTGAAASIAIHTSVILAAVVATGSAGPKPPPPEVRHERPPFYVPLPEGERPSSASPTQRASAEPRFKSLPPAEPLTPTLAWTIGPAPLTDVDPTALLAGDSLGRRAAPAPIGPEASRPVLGDQPATAATADRPAALLAPPRPQYPEQLRAAGVTGRVIVRLVVDTTGRVEPASIVIREASHDLFARAVRVVLPSLRFVPAEVGSRRVRMLVDLPFEFRLRE
jgi:protein TonB